MNDVININGNSITITKNSPSIYGDINNNIVSHGTTNPFIIPSSILDLSDLNDSIYIRVYGKVRVMGNDGELYVHNGLNISGTVYLDRGRYSSWGE